MAPFYRPVAFDLERRCFFENEDGNKVFDCVLITWLNKLTLYPPLIPKGLRGTGSIILETIDVLIPK